MGILDLFRKTKDEVHGAKVLVCAVDCRFDDLVKTDSVVYGQYYRATTSAVLPSIQALLGRLEQKFDIVHLIADVTEAGTIRDASRQEITGTELIQRCCDHDVKLLWAASDNPPERYINGFGARGKRLNLVMTLKRKGPNFSSSFKKYCRGWHTATPCPSLGMTSVRRFRDQITRMRQSRFSSRGVAA